MSYKPHIDGLRALAVLAVVLFHFKVAALGGGFVGVDVFFVISGYLITGIVAGELDQGTFTFSGFYARRARRILPASLVVLVALAVFAPFALPSTDRVVLGNSIAATVFFVSNFFFLAQADYFGADSQTLHLLHTWSLAIEEQFYFFFPLLLFALRRTSRAARLCIVGGVAFSSLLLSIVGTAREPTWAFYLLPSRAWELLAGALIALRPPRLAGSPRLSSALTLAGLASIGGSIFAYGAETPFPGIAAAAPTVGAALVIAAGSSAVGWVRSPLTNRVMIGIGKISYSMYLWHWPMAVAYLVTFGGNPARAPLLLLPLFPVSYVSYRLVEQPFRRTEFLARGPRIALAVATTLGLATYAFVAARTHGFMSLDARAASIADAPRKRRYATTGGQCFATVPWNKFAAAECLGTKPGRRTVFVWGDSVAAHYSGGLRAAARGTDIDILQATMAGCSPSLGWNPKHRPLCKDRNDAVLAHVKQHRPSLMLLAGQWPWEHRPDGYKHPLENSLAALHDLGIRTIVVGPAIEYERPLPELIAEHLKKDKPLKTSGFLSPLARKIDLDMKSGGLELSGAKVISVYDLVCPGWECPALTPEDTPFQWDKQHLSYEGSLIIGKKLFPLIEAELNRR